MKSAREELDVITAYREVGSYRGAAAICGTTHKTVKRIIDRHEAGGRRPARPVRPANYEAVRELVAGKAAATSARISAKRLLPTARAAGYGGSARNFRRLVAADQPQVVALNSTVRLLPTAARSSGCPSVRGSADPAG